VLTPLDLERELDYAGNIFRRAFAGATFLFAAGAGLGVLQDAWITLYVRVGDASAEESCGARADCEPSDLKEWKKAS